MNTLTINQSRTRPAFRSVKALVGCYAGVSVLALLAIVLLRNHTADVNSAVWTRGTIVVVSALVTVALTLRAERGSRRAYLRLRIISAVMVVAIAVIVSLPGTFPIWMKLEQGLCGLLLIGVVVLVNGKDVRSQFSAK
jgi:hypothetical protein